MTHDTTILDSINLFTNIYQTNRRIMHHARLPPDACACINRTHTCASALISETTQITVATVCAIDSPQDGISYATNGPYMITITAQCKTLNIKQYFISDQVRAYERERAQARDTGAKCHLVSAQLGGGGRTYACGILCGAHAHMYETMRRDE